MIDLLYPIIESSERVVVRLFTIVSGTLWGCAALGMADESAAAEPRRSGWYVGVGVGGNWPSGMKQVGHNRDTTCYPNDDCSHLPGGMPDGYRWRYDLDAGAGAGFEASIGHLFDRARLELSAARRKNDLDEKFSGISYLDETPIRDAGNDIRSNVMTSIGDCITHSLSLNAYYDFPLEAGRITPFLGAGLGLSLRRGVRPELPSQLHGHAKSFRSPATIRSTAGRISTSSTPLLPYSSMPASTTAWGTRLSSA